MPSLVPKAMRSSAECTAAPSTYSRLARPLPLTWLMKPRFALSYMMMPCEVLSQMSPAASVTMLYTDLLRSFSEPGNSFILFAFLSYMYRPLFVPMSTSPPCISQNDRHCMSGSLSPRPSRLKLQSRVSMHDSPLDVPTQSSPRLSTNSAFIQLLQMVPRRLRSVMLKAAWRPVCVSYMHRLLA